MSNVQAGSGQPRCVEGQPGIVTIWVRAATEADATKRAGEIMDAHHYSSHGELSLYLEEASDPATGTEMLTLDEELRCSSRGPLGYERIKDAALREGDGLFEAWLPLAGD
ncbi:MAG TPA: hypothetical protein VK474_00115 [Chthoniobacterales bacterium]|nr:hypothetical protein [Chthoniobacterales bacterium]